jgi:coproporphyrinogen III oxidase
VPEDHFDRAAAYFSALQDRICTALEGLDGDRRFQVDDWRRDGGETDGPVLRGRGSTRVLQEGAVLEKAGVNLSVVEGRFGDETPSAMPGGGREFRATGLSLILHPLNPYVPTVHLNLRRIERGDAAWFAGGADLTPYYLDEGDALHFHGVLRKACDAHPEVADYAAFKAECDQYFYNQHRSEARGIGGIFFDHLREDPEATFAFIRAVGDSFLEAYLPIAERHVDDPFGKRQRTWQELRRGRYVEFNLLWDRGTGFGLKTGGRVESILVSLPPTVRWKYEPTVPPDSAEEALMDVLRQPREWLGPQADAPEPDPTPSRAEHAGAPTPAPPPSARKAKRDPPARAARAPTIEDPDTVVAFTDGASSGNPGPGGWGAVIATGDGQIIEIGGREKDVTNNQMELRAAIESLRLVQRQRKPVLLLTDSRYVTDGITNWIAGWKRRGWSRKQKGVSVPVANVGLWKELDAINNAMQVRWQHVPGHAGVAGNDRADRIAVAFSRDADITLYVGSESDYPADIRRLPEDMEQRSKKNPMGYLSLAGGEWVLHKSWEACKLRAESNPGTRYKKVYSDAHLREVLASWGVQT